MIELKAIAQQFGFNYYKFAHLAMSKPDVYQVDETGRHFMLPRKNMDKLIRAYSGIK